MHRRRPWAALIGLLFHPDEAFRWKTIHTIGSVAARFAEHDFEPVRSLLRRLFWHMNDESGGIVWNAPEVVGEVLLNVPGLLDSFGPNLLYLLNFEPFEDGVHHAAWRWSKPGPTLIASFAEPLEHSMESPFPFRRAMAAAAWKTAGQTPRSDLISILERDERRFRFYDPYAKCFQETSVGAFVKAAKK